MILQVPLPVPERTCAYAWRENWREGRRQPEQPNVYVVQAFRVLAWMLVMLMLMTLVLVSRTSDELAKMGPESTYNFMSGQNH